MITGYRDPIGHHGQPPTGRTRSRRARPSSRRRGDATQSALQLDLVVDDASPQPSGAAEPVPAREESMLVATPPTAGDGCGGADRPDTDKPLLLTAAQIEATLQIGRTLTYELLNSGQIPVVRVGRLIRVSRAALERWIAQHGTAGAEGGVSEGFDLEALNRRFARCRPGPHVVPRPRGPRR